MELPEAPTTKDVAKLAGVSAATVSYVLNGRRDGAGTISEATRKRVLDAMTQLGYAPNQTARSLRRQSTERICLVLPRLNIPYYDILARDVQHVADEHNYSVILALAGSLERERHMLTQLQRRLADGAILDPDYLEADDLAALVKAHYPFVVLSNHLSPQGFDVVQTTESEACYEAVKYLLEKGHRRIAFLGHFEIANMPAHYQRIESYQRALREYGVSIDERLIRGGAGERQMAYRNTLDLLQLDMPPSAIFAASDIAGVSAIWAIRDTGMRVPDDVAVIGVGNIAEGEITSPPLTTVGSTSLNFRGVAELLFSRLQNASLAGREYLLHWKLVLRGSA